MKKYLSFFCLLLAVSSAAYADPENDSVPDVKRIVKDISSTPSDTDKKTSPPTAPPPGQSNTSQNTSVQTPSPPKSNDMYMIVLPLIFGSTALFFALLAMFFVYKFNKQAEQNNKDLRQETEKLNKAITTVKTSIYKLPTKAAGYNTLGEKIGMSDMEEQFKLLDDKVNIASTTLNKKIALLETEIKTLRTAKPSVSDAYSKPDFHSSLLDVMKPPSDQDIIDEISDIVKPLLQLPQEGNLVVFESEYQKPALQRKVKAFLSLKTSLNSTSTRYFDALALFLKQPLASGANTLIYLRSGIGQHSNISAIFKDVPDGAKIKETEEPALLKQSAEQELEFNEQCIVEKGTVSI
jgi:hypothetical protein